MREAKRPKKVGSLAEAVGALVAHYRRKRRLTQEQFAELANMHVDTVGSIEQGRLALQPDRAEQFDETLQTGGALAVLIANMPVRERIVQFAQGLVDHEQEAVSILSYQSLVIPGLLQTRDYCRAVFDYRYPALKERNGRAVGRRPHGTPVDLATEASTGRALRPGGRHPAPRGRWTGR
ncbi:hypothetical protein SFUMM280S_02481 [Streptomyces fumanus]